MRDIVLKVFPFASPVDDRVDPFAAEVVVDRTGFGPLVQIVEEFVDGLSVVVLNIFEFLIKGIVTILEAIPLPIMGILSKKCLGSSRSS